MSEIKTRPAPVAVSASAARRIGVIIAKEARSDLRFRISVSGGGCSGFRYDFGLDHKLAPDDIEVERDGAKVVVDGMSLMYVLGSELDFVEDLNGSYFKMVNPNAKSGCGCGASFAV